MAGRGIVTVKGSSGDSSREVDADRRSLIAALAVAGGLAPLSAVNAGAMTTPESSAVPSHTERTVLCFGDSNTWGFVPGQDSGATRFTRYDHLTRWPRALENLLAPGTRVIEHGICGLVGALSSGGAQFEDGASRAAIDHVRGLISANWPIHEWVVMLGTNDLAYPTLEDPARIADGVVTTIEQGLASHAWLGGAAPAVTVVSPIPLGPAVRAIGVDEAGIERSRGLAREFSLRATPKGWRFLDAAGAGALDTADGIHWSAAHHQRFAEMLAKALAGRAQR